MSAGRFLMYMLLCIILASSGRNVAAKYVLECKDEATRENLRQILISSKQMVRGSDSDLATDRADHEQLVKTIARLNELSYAIYSNRLPPDRNDVLSTLMTVNTYVGGIEWRPSGLTHGYSNASDLQRISRIATTLIFLARTLSDDSSGDIKRTQRVMIVCDADWLQKVPDRPNMWEDNRPTEASDSAQGPGRVELSDENPFNYKYSSTILAPAFMVAVRSFTQHLYPDVLMVHPGHLNRATKYSQRFQPSWAVDTKSASKSVFSRPLRVFNRLGDSHLTDCLAVGPEPHVIRQLSTMSSAAQYQGIKPASLGRGPYYHALALDGRRPCPADEPWLFSCVTFLATHAPDKAITFADNFMYLVAALALHNADWSTGYIQRFSDANNMFPNGVKLNPHVYPFALSMYLLGRPPATLIPPAQLPKPSRLKKPTSTRNPSGQIPPTEPIFYNPPEFPKNSPGLSEGVARAPWGPKRIPATYSSVEYNLQDYEPFNWPMYRKIYDEDPRDPMTVTQSFFPPLLGGVPAIVEADYRTNARTLPAFAYLHTQYDDSQGGASASVGSIPSRPIVIDEDGASSRPIVIGEGNPSSGPVVIDEDDLYGDPEAEPGPSGTQEQPIPLEETGVDVVRVHGRPIVVDSDGSGSDLPIRTRPGSAHKRPRPQAGTPQPQTAPKRHRPSNADEERPE